MVKKTHLVNKKKGITLVEMMASLAILLILFCGITNMILTNMKAEIKSNTRMENISYIKAIMAMFEVEPKVEKTTDGGGESTTTASEYISNNIFANNLLGKETYFTFNNFEGLKTKLINGYVTTSIPSNNDNYLATLNVEEVKNYLYKIDVNVENIFKNEVTEKTLYINKEIE